MSFMISRSDLKPFTGFRGDQNPSKRFEIATPTTYETSTIHLFQYSLRNSQSRFDFGPYILLYLLGGMTPHEAQKHTHEVWLSCGTVCFPNGIQELCVASSYVLKDCNIN